MNCWPAWRRPAPAADLHRTGRRSRSAPGQILADAPAPPGQRRGAVVEQGEVVHVAQIARRAQHFLHEVAQAVEMDVGEERAGEVADGQPRRRSKRVSRSPPG